MRRWAAVYVAAGVVSVAYRAHHGINNPSTYQQLVGGVLLWPVVWVLDALSPLFDRDDETVEEGDRCCECGQVAPMPWRTGEEWVMSHLCARCLWGPSALAEYTREWARRRA